MQFQPKSDPRRRGPRTNLVPKLEGDFSQYGNQNLQFYSEYPKESVSMREFEELAYTRLKVLKGVEHTRERNGKGTDFDNKLPEVLRPLLKILCVSTRSEPAEGKAEQQILEERRKDYLSHFILRLAFCRSPDAQKWFIQQELDLFRYRFRIENSKVVKGFLLSNGFDYKLLGRAEKSEILSELVASHTFYKFGAETANEIDYWLVPFVEALDLVKSRKVFLRNGMAYVPADELGVIVAARFRQNLSKALVVASKHFGLLEESDRLLPFLKRLSSRAYMGKDYANNDNSNRVTPAMIDELSKSSFPLCMREMHEHLCRHHHLKHGGRMQYGLFLKGIGMQLDDAMDFWRREFTKNIDSDKFEKQYAYNIRHNYGKEGKRADYTPYHCTKIITGNPPGPQDSHGCPFKHYDTEQLKKRLEALNLTTDRINSVLSLSKSGRYDQACSRFFEATHKMPEQSLGMAIGHPNQYYEESRKVLSGQRTAQAVPVVESQMFEKRESQEDQFSDDDEMINSMQMDE